MMTLPLTIFGMTSYVVVCESSATLMPKLHGIGLRPGSLTKAERLRFGSRSADYLESRLTCILAKNCSVVTQYIKLITTSVIAAETSFYRPGKQRCMHTYLQMIVWVSSGCGMQAHAGLLLLNLAWLFMPNDITIPFMQRLVMQQAWPMEASTPWRKKLGSFFTAKDTSTKESCKGSLL